MIDSGYLEKGLYAMSRAHRVNAMAGHLGAAVVAATFIGEVWADLDASVYTGIEEAVERIIHGQSGFSPGRDAAITVAEMFEPHAKEEPNEDLIDGIAGALAHNIDQTRESGHNVIFAAIAIRALKSHPGFATPPVIDGIRRLIAGFDDAQPGSGYYGRQRGRISGGSIALPKDDLFPPYASMAEMAHIVMDELIEHAAERRVGYGGLTHIINHAAALTELDRYGYPELAARGFAAHRQHLCLLRTVPDVTDELGAPLPAEHDPRTPAYWQSENIRRDTAQLDHRIKLLYGFDTLIERVEDPHKRKLANERLRYLM